MCIKINGTAAEQKYEGIGAQLSRIKTRSQRTGFVPGSLNNVVVKDGVVAEEVNALNLWDEVPCFDCEHYTHCHFEKNLSGCPKIQAELKINIENSAIFEVYQRFKHLDSILRGMDSSDSPINQAATLMWRAIKKDLMVEFWDSPAGIIINASDDKAGENL